MSRFSVRMSKFFLWRLCLAGAVSEGVCRIPAKKRITRMGWIRISGGRRAGRGVLLLSYDGVRMDAWVEAGAVNGGDMWDQAG